MQRKRLLTWLLAAVLLGATGYAYYWVQARRVATLARIAALDSQLTDSNQRAAERAVHCLQYIDQRVCQFNSNDADLVVLRQGQQIWTRTRTLLATIQQASDPASPSADTLSRQLNQYVVFLRPLLPKAPALTQTLLAATQRERAQLSNELVASHAALTGLAAQVHRAEEAALNQQVMRLGTYCGFDTFGILAVPVSETVAPGQEYQARLFFSYKSWRTYCHAGLTANGQPVVQSGTGQLPVRLVVPPARPGQPDTVRAQWQGSIRVGDYPTDTVLQVTVS